MRKFSLPALVTVIGLSLAVAGCSQVGVWRGQKAFKDANKLYTAQDYRGAAAKYEEAVAANPDLGEAYFFLGNSYDNLYRPVRRGEPDNDELLTKAVENYRKAVEIETQPDNMRKLSLEYLVAAYGPDKLNDPAESETLLLQMIDLEPTEPTNYFALGNIYEQSGLYEEAEATFLKAKEVRPTEPTVYTTLAGFYNRLGDFDKTIQALRERAEREPENPEAHHIIATYYWDKVYRDFRLQDTEKQEFLEAGIESEDKAISLKGDYFEAITYKNLLLRLQANIEKDPGRQQALLREADRLRDQAVELRKQQQAAAEAPAAGQ